MNTKTKILVNNLVNRYIKLSTEISISIIAVPVSIQQLAQTEYHGNIYIFC